MSQHPPIPVACAVIVDDAGRVLVARRPPDKHLAGKWEFPGGKIEPGEAPAAALHREIEEELGCAVVLGRRLHPFVHDYGTHVIELHPFVCRFVDPEAVPRAREHAELAWMAKRDLPEIDLAPADRPVLQALEDSAKDLR